MLQHAVYIVGVYPFSIGCHMFFVGFSEFLEVTDFVRETAHAITICIQLLQPVKLYSGHTHTVNICQYTELDEVFLPL